MMTRCFTSNRTRLPSFSTRAYGLASSSSTPRIPRVFHSRTRMDISVPADLQSHEGWSIYYFQLFLIQEDRMPTERI
ncbi:hypothetical protein PM082_015645 [Marasmius tenuissimus]|nr:hypothetical protein PM082_015645 [Marasmius tenuissimus]